jgi:hypothetical protein
MGSTLGVDYWDGDIYSAGKLYIAIGLGDDDTFVFGARRSGNLELRLAGVRQGYIK